MRPNRMTLRRDPPAPDAATATAARVRAVAARVSAAASRVRAAVAVAIAVTLAPSVGMSPPAALAAAAPDKSRYHLFDPTPRDQMRDFATDRPDVTENPRTLDAGHFQVEMSLVDYVRDDSNGDTLDEFAVLPSNIKVGLLNNLDLQLVLEPYVHQRVRPAGSDNDATLDGFGNLQLRAKLNLWGNDSGDTALAVMPFVQFPTASEDLGGTDHLEGGLIVPFAAELPHEWQLALMAELDLLRNVEDDGYGVSLIHTATVGHAIAGDLAGYVEYVGVASRELDAGYIALVGAGLTLSLGENAQLDGGAYVGISDEADDFRAFLGLSVRL